MMKLKKILLVFCGLVIATCFVVVLGIRLFQFISALVELSQLRYYPERAPSRELVSADGFSLVWNKEIGDGSKYIFYTQIFLTDDTNLIYITPYTMNSIDLHTGQPLWSTQISEDRLFHLYENKIFSLNSYDKDVPFMHGDDFPIPAKCGTHDKGTLRVYDPQTGNIVWENSYRGVTPSPDIYFVENRVVISGLTITFNKYISDFEVDIDSGQVLRATCQNLNKYERISKDEGSLSSGYSPITREWEWGENIDSPAFIAEGKKIIMVDRETRQPVEEIVFSGFSLNPDAVTIIIKNDFLVIYLDDSNQFFTFRME